MKQIEAQQNMLRNKLKHTRPEFAAEQISEIDKLKDTYAFTYYKYLQNNENDASKDSDFIAYLNTIDLNDTTKIRTIKNAIECKLSIYPQLYPNESTKARYYCFIRDSIQNQDIREHIADIAMFSYLSTGADKDLIRTFEIYKNISYTSKLYKKNEKAYKNLARLFPGVMAMNFNMQNVNGTTVKFLDIIGKGKVTYIDFWATWCGPCCAEIPYVKSLVEKFKGNPKIEFISISLDKDLKKWHQKLNADKPSWRQFIIPENFNSDFAKEYNITAIPRFMIFDSEGKIITINAERPSNPDIEKILNSYLK